MSEAIGEVVTGGASGTGSIQGAESKPKRTRKNSTYLLYSVTPIGKESMPTGPVAGALIPVGKEAGYVSPEAAAKDVLKSKLAGNLECHRVVWARSAEKREVVEFVK